MTPPAKRFPTECRCGDGDGGTDHKDQGEGIAIPSPLSKSIPHSNDGNKKLGRLIKPAERGWDSKKEDWHIL